MKLASSLPGIPVKVPFGWGKTLYGGPFYDVVDIDDPAVCKVKMAVEIRQSYDISIPTKDFSTPLVLDMRLGIIDALEALSEGKTLYVGCMGGIGRTGLFIGILAKTLGIKNPVEWTREHFKSHAIETDKQVEYVNKFYVGELQLIAKKLSFKSKWQFWK